MALFGWHLVLLGALIAVGVATALVVRRARRSNTATPVVRLAFIISSAWAVVTTIGAVFITASWFTPSTWPMFDIRVQYNPWDQTCTTLPAPDALVTTPCVYGAFTEANVSASGLSIPTRQLLAAGDLTGSLVSAALASLVALACWRLMQARPFAPEIARLALVAAGIVLIGGLAAQVLLQVGGAAAASEVVNAGTAPEGMIPAPDFSWDLWPIGVAIGLGAFSVLVRYGSRLQRETEGLV